MNRSRRHLRFFGALVAGRVNAGRGDGTDDMMAFISSLIGNQPILTVFLVIGLGYAVGQVNILGFSLGVGAVLFVGLFIGAIAPKAQIAGPIGLIGLVMFLYGIGILYGRQFFEGLTGLGRKYNLLAFIAVLGGLCVALGLGTLFKVQPGYALGIFAGSMTSTPTLQAALDVTGNGEPSIGYSVTYPFGVIGPILCFYFMTRKVKPTFLPKPARFHMGEVTIERLPDSGATIAAVLAIMPEGVQIASVRQQHRNLLPNPDLRLRSGDGLLIAADDAASLQRAVELLGRLSPGRIAGDRSDLSYQRFFVSKAGLTGRKLADLAMPAGVPLQILHVRRYDVDLVPAPDLMLEIGDRVGLIVPPEHIATARAWFGDTVKSTADFSYVSVGFGMALGVLLGLVPIPIPGVGTVSLGIGGGPLIVALIVGRLRRTGPISWVMPLPANIVLRNFGLTLFLATVGINSGQAFVTTVTQAGPLMLMIGAAVLLTTMAIVLLAGHYLMRIPFDDLLGVASGATGNPAILVYATRMAPTDRPDIGYAMIFPSTTITKVVVVQIMGLIFQSG
jgi:putative transport protein